MVALTAVAAAFLGGRPRLIRPGLIGFSAARLADWLAACGYLALARVPAPAGKLVAVTVP